MYATCFGTFDLPHMDWMNPVCFSYPAVTASMTTVANTLKSRYGWYRPPTLHSPTNSMSALLSNDSIA